MPGGRGEGGARGRGLISCAPGRSGHHVCRHYDRHARCVAGSGQAVGGVTPAPWTVCPRNLPGSHQGTTHPLGRAVVERRQASAPDSGRRGASRSFRGAPRTPYACGWYGPRLPAFRFPYFICRKRAAKSCSATARSGPLWIGWLADPRHRKGGGKQNSLFDIARARGARARTGSYCIRPREAGEHLC